jgi:RNA polymerase sigma-70 factor (sigma-E family)
MGSPADMRQGSELEGGGAPRPARGAEAAVAAPALRPALGGDLDPPATTELSSTQPPRGGSNGGQFAGGGDSAQKVMADVVAKVIAEREPGFTTLYADRYLPMVRLATLLVDRVEVAEEIVQDAYAVLYRRWDRIENPQAYLRLEVVNRSRDALRRRRVARRLTFRSTEVRDHPDEMADAIARLPERQRTAVVLRFYEDLAIEQIAEAMGTRPGTVKSWLHRAMARLRGEIER